MIVAFCVDEQEFRALGTHEFYHDWAEFRVSSTRVATDGGERGRSHRRMITSLTRVIVGMDPRTFPEIIPQAFLNSCNFVGIQLPVFSASSRVGTHYPSHSLLEVNPKK